MPFAPVLMGAVLDRWSSFISINTIDGTNDVNKVDITLHYDVPLAAVVMLLTAMAEV